VNLLKIKSFKQYSDYIILALESKQLTELRDFLVYIPFMVDLINLFIYDVFNKQMRNQKSK